MGLPSPVWASGTEEVLNNFTPVNRGTLENENKNNGGRGPVLKTSKLLLREQGRDAAHNPNDTLALGRAYKASSQTSRELPPGPGAPGEEVKGTIWVNSVTLSSKEQASGFKNH